MCTIIVQKMYLHACVDALYQTVPPQTASLCSDSPTHELVRRKDREDAMQ